MAFGGTSTCNRDFMSPKHPFRLAELRMAQPGSLLIAAFQLPVAVLNGELLAGCPLSTRSWVAAPSVVNLLCEK